MKIKNYYTIFYIFITENAFLNLEAWIMSCLLTELYTNVTYARSRISKTMTKKKDHEPWF